MRRRADDAKKAFAEAARLSPTLVPAQIALSRLNLRDGDATSALSFAQQAVRSAPASIEARTAVVWALVGQKNIVRAQEELRAIAALRPNSPDLLVLQGTIDMMRKDPKAAERSFRKALEIRPESYEALAGMLQTQMVTGNLAAAREAAEAAVARAPSNAATLVLAARTYYQARQFDRAEQSLRKALDIDPQQLDAYALLGQIYIVQRRTDQAITEFDELSRRQSNPVSAHTIVGMLLQAANRRADAKARYRTVLALDPSAAVAANNLAWLQVEDGENLDVALQLAQTSKSRLPDSPEVSHTLGYIYYLKGLYPSAIEALRLSIEKQPGVALYHHHLGMAYAKSGKVALARQSLDRALRLDGSFSGADEARATLASLK
jgi:tetratricopeptide (TPR) repeat protein